jgi:2'-5' RNA ligase
MSKTWKQFLTEKYGETHDFSSTQVNLPSGLAGKIIKWGKDNIPEDVLYKSGDSFGREDEIHATILYGLHDKNPKAVKNLIKDVKSLKLKLGKISLFTSDEYDVVKISVISSDLRNLNSKFKANLKYSSDYPRYQPHITIAYVKKGEGDKYNGNGQFMGEKAIIDHIIFSSKNNVKTRIELV